MLRQTPRGVRVSQTNSRRVKSALFATTVLGAMIAMGTFGLGAAHAEGTCDISKFKNPDATLDTTGYLACVQPASVSAPKPADDCPTAELQLMATAEPSELSPGSTTTFTSVGFEPGSEVELFLCSTPTSLGTFTAGPDGKVEQSLTVPSGTVLGTHTVAAVGKRANGLELVSYAAVNVVSPSAVAPAPVATVSQSGALPVTGNDNGRTIAIGAALVVLGGAVIFGSAKARRPAND